MYLEILELDEKLFTLDEYERAKIIKRAWSRLIAPFASKDKDKFHKGTKARDQLLDQVLYTQIKTEILSGEEAIKEKELIINHIQDREYELALSLIERYMQQYRDDFLINRERAHCFEMKSQYDKAIDCYLQLLQYTTTYSDLCSIAELYNSKHDEAEDKKYYHGNDLEKSRTYFLHASELDPSKSRAYHGLAMTYFRNSVAEAEPWFIKAIETKEFADLTDFNSYYWLALLYLKYEAFDKLDNIIIKIENTMPDDEHVRMFISERFNSLTESLLESPSGTNNRLIKKLIEISSRFDRFNPWLSFTKERIENNLKLYDLIEKLSNDNQVTELITHLAKISFNRHLHGQSEEYKEARSTLLGLVDNVDMEELILSSKRLIKHYNPLYELDEYVFDLILHVKENSFIYYKDIKAACDCYDLNDVFKNIARVTHDEFLGIIDERDFKIYIKMIINQLELLQTYDVKRNMETVYNKYIGLYYAQKGIFDVIIDVLISAGHYSINKRDVPKLESMEIIVERKKKNKLATIKKCMESKSYHEVIALCKKIFPVLNDDSFTEEIIEIYKKAQGHIESSTEKFWEAKYSYLNKDYQHSLTKIAASLEEFPHNEATKRFHNELKTLEMEQQNIFNVIDSYLSNGDLSLSETKINEAMIKYGESNKKVNEFKLRLINQNNLATKKIKSIQSALAKNDLSKSLKEIDRLKKINSDKEIIDPLEKELNKKQIDLNERIELVYNMIYMFDFFNAKKQLIHLSEDYPQQAKLEELKDDFEQLNRKSISLLRTLKTQIAAEEWLSAQSFYQEQVVELNIPGVFCNWLVKVLDIYNYGQSYDYQKAFQLYQELKSILLRAEINIDPLIDHFKELQRLYRSLHTGLDQMKIKASTYQEFLKIKEKVFVNFPHSKELIDLCNATEVKYKIKFDLKARIIQEALNIEPYQALFLIKQYLEFDDEGNNKFELISQQVHEAIVKIESIIEQDIRHLISMHSYEQALNKINDHSQNYKLNLKLLKLQHDIRELAHQKESLHKKIKQDAEHIINDNSIANYTKFAELDKNYEECLKRFGGSNELKSKISAVSRKYFDRLISYMNAFFSSPKLKSDYVKLADCINDLNHLKHIDPGDLVRLEATKLKLMDNIIKTLQEQKYAKEFFLAEKFIKNVRLLDSILPPNRDKYKQLIVEIEEDIQLMNEMTYELKILANETYNLLAFYRKLKIYSERYVMTPEVKSLNSSVNKKTAVLGIVFVTILWWLI